jgi:uncharacterized small protein (DUF1192 family)
MSWFRRLFKKKHEGQSSQSDLLSLLNARGISVSIQELAEEMDRARQNLEVRSVLPEVLVRSFNGADLAATPDGYRMDVSMGIPNDNLELLFLLATTYATVSELAKKSDVREYAMEVGDVIGIHEPSDYDHPIHSLFNPDGG